MFQDKKSERAILINNTIGSIQIVIGGFCSFVFGITFMVSVGYMFDYIRAISGDVVIFIFIILVIFLFMLICGIRRIRLAGKCSSYILLLNQRKSNSIDQIAAVLNKPVAKVRSDLERMIRKGFIVSAYIDNNTNCLNSTQIYQCVQVMPMPNSSIPNMMKPDQYPKPVNLTVVICKNCGASNKAVIGESRNCEYCSSILY